MNQKHEAIKRLKKFGLGKKALRNFENNTGFPIVNVDGIVTEVGEEHKKALEEYNARKIGGYPYYMIDCRLCGFRMITILFVSDYMEEWEMDHELITEEGAHIAFVFNVDSPQVSEIGDVGIKAIGDVLYRIW